MQWKQHDDGWRWWFALLPINVSLGPDKHWIWLEWYRYRFAGFYYEVELNQQETSK